MWGNRIMFLYVEQQDIVNYRDFSSKCSRSCYARLLPTYIRHDYWDIFVKVSLSDRLVGFTVLVGMTLLAVFVLLPIPNCLLKICLPTFFAPVLKYFLTPTVCAFSGTADSNGLAPNRFDADTLPLRNIWNSCCPNNFSKCTLSLPTLSTNTSIEWNLYFSWSNHLVTSCRLEMNVGGFCKHQNKTSDAYRYKRFF